MPTLITGIIPSMPLISSAKEIRQSSSTSPSKSTAATLPPIETPSSTLSLSSAAVATVATATTISSTTASLTKPPISPTVIMEKLHSIVTHLECPICLSIMDDTHINPDCSHRFCGPCIKESLRKCKNECPTCRVHVATKRRLRRDDLFDNLIQKLSCIIAESTTDLNNIDLKGLSESLKALLWHFQCPLCSNELKETHISSECLHRFCKGCLLSSLKPSSSSLKLSSKSMSSSRTASVASGITSTTAATATAAHFVDTISKCSECPCCKNNVPTTFFQDKEYESINQAIHFIIRSIDGNNIHENNYKAIKTEQTESYSSSHSKKSHTLTTGPFTNAIPDDVTSDMLHTRSGIENHAAMTEQHQHQQYHDQNVDLGDNDFTSNDNDNDNDNHTTDMNPKNINNHQVVVREGEEEEILLNHSMNSANQMNQQQQPQQHQHQHKYDIGSRFIIQKTETYGRITGYDGEYYQVHFPKDNSCDKYKEENFTAVKFIQPHKRPSTQGSIFSRTQKNEKSSRDASLRCPRCLIRFSSNPKDEASGRAPVQSQNCAHVMCINCVQAIRMNDASLPKNKKNGRNNNNNISSSGGGTTTRKLRATVDCPFCKKLKSFNAADPTICVVMCEMVRLYEQMEHQRTEDRIRRKIDDEEIQRKQMKRRHHHHHRQEVKKRHRSSRNEKEKNDDERELKKERNDAGKLKTSSSSLSHKNIHPRCKSCKKEKPTEKFSSKQLEKIKQKSRPLCRRCEEKGILKKQFGNGADKVCTTVLMAKKHGSKPKFLTTLVPWHKGAVLTESTPLPPNLIIDGYTRDAWGHFENNDTQQEDCWSKGSFWSSGNGIPSFLSFLREREKSAYGTYVLPNQTDGFFVIPFDQPTQSEETQSNIIQCKYILGLGLLGGNDGDSTNAHCNTSRPNSSPSVQEEGHMVSSSLRSLLAAEFKSSQSLMAVPKGSVKAAQKLSSRPEGPAPSFGPTGGWFRERTIIKEHGVDDDTDSDEDKSPTQENRNKKFIL